MILPVEPVVPQPVLTRQSRARTLEDARDRVRFECRDEEVITGPNLTQTSGKGEAVEMKEGARPTFPPFSAEI